jgi:hypothetical protein
MRQILRVPPEGDCANHRLIHGQTSVWAEFSILGLAYLTKQSNLKLKTQPKQLSGSLPLAFTPSDKSKTFFCHFHPLPATAGFEPPHLVNLVD